MTARSIFSGKTLTPFQKVCLAGVLGAIMMGAVGATVAVTGWTLLDTSSANHP